MGNTNSHKHLIRVKQGDQEKLHYLDRDEFVLGRGATSNIRVPSKVVSDQHVMIRIQGNQVQICDLGSAHGTFMGGTKLPSRETITLKEPMEEFYLGNAVSISVMPKAMLEEEVERDVTIELPAVAGGQMPGRDFAIKSDNYRSDSETKNSLRLIQIEQKTAGSSRVDETVHESIESSAAEIEAIKEGATRFAQTLREETRKEAQNIIAQADAKRREIESDRTRLELLLNAVKGQVEALQAEKAHLEQQFLQLDLQLKSNQGNLADLKIKKDQQEKALLQTEKHRAEVEAQISHLRTEITHLEQEIESKKHAFMQHEGEIAELQDTISELRQTVTEVRESVRREKEIAEFEIRGQRAKREAMISETHSKHLSLEAVLAKLETKKSALEREVQEVIQSKAAVQGEIENAKRGLQQQIDQANDRFRVLEMESQKLITKIEEQRNTIDQLRLEIAERQNAIQELNAQKDKLELDVSTGRERFEQSLSSVNEQKKRAEFEVAELQSAIDSLVFRRNELLRDNDRILDEVSSQKEAAQIQLRAVESQSREFHTKLQVDREESDRLRTLVAEETDRLHKLEDEHKKVRDSIEAIQQSKYTLADEVMDLASKRDMGKIQYEEQTRRLESELETMRKQGLAEVENEIRVRKTEYEKQFVENKAAFEKEIEDIRDLEHEKLEQLRRRNEEVERSRRTHICNEIVSSTLELARRKPLSEVEGEFRRVISIALEGRSSAALSAKADARTRKFFKKIMVWVSGPALAALVLLLFPHLPSKLMEHLEHKAAIEKKESGGVFLEEIRQRGQMFQPEKMDRNYRENYAENVIYLEGYAEMKSNLEKQKEWTLLLNDFIVGRLGLSDRSIPDFIAAESVMVKGLIEIRKGIVAQFKDQGLQRMATMEKLDLEKILRILQSQENYKKFRALEKSFYEAYMKNRDTLNRTPAAGVGGATPSH